MDLIIARLGYLGIVLVLVLGGLGLPVPEEAPIILAAVLSSRNQMFWPLALAACFLGVLAGDFVVYALGYFQGERVLSFRLTRRFLSREREAQIKGYFHRHGIRILIAGRFVPGFRTAAYLTAGILRLPPMRLFLADLCAVTLSTLLMFGLGYFFTQWVETQWKHAQGYGIVALGIGVIGFLLYRHYKAQKRGGGVVGPPVPIEDVVPVPVDDLRSGILRRPRPETPAEVAPVPIPPTPTSPDVIRVDTISVVPVLDVCVPAPPAEIVVVTPSPHDQPVEGR
ncbi:MAG: Inner rane protein [Planctomycetota bacterium]|nr:Inner rane protein [Planctomycetota bacterium]